MSCISISITLKLGNSCTRTHKVTIRNDEKSYDHFILTISQLFNISPNILNISYFDHFSKCEKLLDEKSFPWLLNQCSLSRIYELSIVGIHYEILEVVEDFCCAVSKLSELIEQSSLLLNWGFSNDNEADDLDSILMKYRQMVETGLHPWQSTYCDNNRKYFNSQEMSNDFLYTAKALQSSHLTWKKLSTIKARKLKGLQLLTLNLMWNFLAKKDDRLHWYKHGALQFAIGTFVDADSHSDVYDSLKELSIGILVQFTEMEDAKSNLISNTSFMNKFCHQVLTDTRCLSSNNEELIYSGQLRLNTLMCLLSSPVTHKIFLEQNIITILVQIAPFIKNNVASYYFFSLCVAFVFGFSLDMIVDKTEDNSICCKKCKVNSLCQFKYLSSMVFDFWQHFSPSAQYRFEVEKQYIWITMKPYVELAWCYRQPPCQDAITSNSFIPYHDVNHSKEKLNIPKLMGIWALDSMTRNKENLKIINDEGLKDFVTMISWDFPQFIFHKPVDCVCESPPLCLNYIAEMMPQPPSLQNICRGKLIKYNMNLTPQIGINGSITDILKQLRYT